MNLLQLLSHDEQMEAHRYAFARYWEAAILPTLGEQAHDPEIVAASQACHWALWRRDHHLLPKP